MGGRKDYEELFENAADNTGRRKFYAPAQKSMQHGGYPMDVGAL